MDVLDYEGLSSLRTCKYSNNSVIVNVMLRLICMLSNELNIEIDDLACKKELYQ